MYEIDVCKKENGEIAICEMYNILITGLKINPLHFLIRVVWKLWNDKKKKKGIYTKFWDQETIFSKL